MSHPNPAAALNGRRSGNVCDRCNRRVRTGDLIRAYAVYYDADGWTIRRVMCPDCGSTTIGPPTNGADEVVVEAVYWRSRLVGIETVDRSRP